MEMTPENKSQPNYCVVVVDIRTKRAVGVDFCKDLEELNYRATMTRRDCGDDCIVLTYPDSLAIMGDALTELAGEVAVFS